ncbi:hypothetical protein F5Y07DRAFT_355428 [Xylaria sp. FL0933]|nr:hypothetical protein F5Y07DRAFT_355428 [Xylaria sp. FL0933]
MRRQWQRDDELRGQLCSVLYSSGLRRQYSIGSLIYWAHHVHLLLRPRRSPISLPITSIVSSALDRWSKKASSVSWVRAKSFTKIQLRRLGLEKNTADCSISSLVGLVEGLWNIVTIYHWMELGPSFFLFFSFLPSSCVLILIF